MKILVHCNSPNAPTGYGTQGMMLMSGLKKLGYDVVHVSNYGVQGSPLTTDDGIRIYPAGWDMPAQAGNVKYVAHTEKPDVVITLVDLWSLRAMHDDDWKWPWVAWFPVDSDPLKKPEFGMLEKVDVPVVYSRYGKRVVEAAGFQDVVYIPHGLDMQKFVPMDPQQARKTLNFPEDAFIVGFVGANAFMPSRKGIAEGLLAFRELLLRRPNVVLYMHTTWNTDRGGIDLTVLLDELGITEHVFSPNQSAQRMGLIPHDKMPLFYSAFDVLLAPSMGEGFNLPVLEAEACGIPVVGTRTSGQQELIEQAGGWLVDGQPYRRPMDTWWQMPKVDLLARALIQAYDERSKPQWGLRKQAARSFAERYDFDQTVLPLWNELLRGRDWDLEKYQEKEDEPERPVIDA